MILNLFIGILMTYSESFLEELIPLKRWWIVSLIIVFIDTNSYFKQSWTQIMIIKYYILQLLILLDNFMVSIANLG